MLTSAWMPLAISWILVMAKDSPQSRQMMTGAMAMTNIGVMGLHWMGLMSFIMSATNKSFLGQPINTFFAIFYLLACAGMVAFQYLLSPGVYNWLKNAPLARNETNVAALCVEC